VGDDEARARATLNEMQLRISEGPHAALGVEDTASPDQVRSAFLELTKQFHPARFARLSPELHRLSNEVFLGIKSAHDQLVKQLGGGRRGSYQSGAPSFPPGSPLARGTDRSAPVIARTKTPTGAPRAPTPPTTRPGTPPPTRPGTPPPAGASRPTPPPAAGSRPTPPPAAASRPTPPSGATPARPTPSPARVGAPPGRTPPSGISAQRPTAARPVTPPSAQGLNPDTVRHSGAPTFDERAALRECLMLLNDRRWTPAREALNNLATRVPQSKNYRALLGYARGREAQAAGRHQEAELEYLRALQLDPELALAKQALAEVQQRR
jgi:hypothetical protein